MRQRLSSSFLVFPLHIHNNIISFIFKKRLFNVRAPRVYIRRDGRPWTERSTTAVTEPLAAAAARR